MPQWATTPVRREVAKAVQGLTDEQKAAMRQSKTRVRVDVSAWLPPGKTCGIDVGRRLADIRRLVMLRFRGQACKLDPDDLVQEVVERILRRNTMASAWNPAKGSPGHYVHLVTSGAIAILLDKRNRIDAHELLGGASGHDDEGEGLDEILPAYLMNGDAEDRMLSRVDAAREMQRRNADEAAALVDAYEQAEGAAIREARRAAWQRGELRQRGRRPGPPRALTPVEHKAISVIESAGRSVPTVELRKLLGLEITPYQRMMCRLRNLGVVKSTGHGPAAAYYKLGAEPPQPMVDTAPSEPEEQPATPEQVELEELEGPPTERDRRIDTAMMRVVRAAEPRREASRAALAKAWETRRRNLPAADPATEQRRAARRAYDALVSKETEQERDARRAAIREARKRQFCALQAERRAAHEPVLAEIAEYIMSETEAGRGVHGSELRYLLSLDHGTFARHMMQLRKRGLVRIEGYGKGSSYRYCGGGAVAP